MLPQSTWVAKESDNSLSKQSNTMKKCPTCSQTFADDILFCIYDASVLITPPAMPPSEQLNTPSLNSGANAKHQVSRLYLVISGMGLVILGLGFSLIAMYGNRNAVEPGVQANSPPGRAQPSVRPPSAAETTQAIREAPSKTPAPRINLTDVDGFWKGKWSTDSGTMLDIEFTLRSVGDNRVEGQIKWTMRRTVRPDKKEKIGLSATEYIRGSFDPSTRLLTASGYRKDDPNDVLVMLDNYRLTVSEDGHHLTGVARNGGRWNGHLDLDKN